MTYTIEGYNSQYATAYGIVITDTLPANTDLVPGSITGDGVENGGVITWTLGNVEPGRTGTLSFAVIPNASAGGVTQTVATLSTEEVSGSLVLTSTAITPHTANLIQFVAEDFFLVAALYKKELAEADSPASDIRAAIRRAYRDIPPEWIDAVCQSGARIIQLVHRRVGELTRSGGRGEYELWRRMNPGYVGKIKSTAREQAARITLDYP